MNDITVEKHAVLPPMIDTHCHLDDRQFASDLEQVLETSRQANVPRWILIGYDPERWNQVIDLTNQHQGMAHTLGVHPSSAPAWNGDTEERLRALLISSNAVGIGEAGLDFYRDNAPPQVQADAFAGQLQLAVELNLPLVIHMRSAEQEMIAVLTDGRELPTLLFHSFDGSAQLMDVVLELGSYVGIGGLATRQQSTALRTQLARVPVERLVLETDSPYLVPARQKDRRNQPAHIATIAMMMAEHLDISAHALAAQSTANAEHLFGLDHAI